MPRHRLAGRLTGWRFRALDRLYKNDDERNHHFILKQNSKPPFLHNKKLLLDFTDMTGF